MLYVLDFYNIKKKKLISFSVSNLKKSIHTHTHTHTHMHTKTEIVITSC